MHAEVVYTVELDLTVTRWYLVTIWFQVSNLRSVHYETWTQSPKYIHLVLTSMTLVCM